MKRSGSAMHAAAVISATVTTALAMAACGGGNAQAPPPGVSTVTAAAPDALAPPDTQGAAEHQTATAPPPAPTASEALPPCPSRTQSFVFESDSANVTPEQDHALQQLAACLTSGVLRTATVIAVGHADPVGNADSNLGLGLTRAARVKAFLVAHGVPTDRVIATSEGARSSASMSAGRRVDLFFALSAPKQP